MHTRRTGFTLIEVLVVIAIIGILIGLLVPAVQRVRSIAARMNCGNNLRTWAQAAHQYEGSNGHYPIGTNSGDFTGAVQPTKRYNWIQTLLPYVDQEASERLFNLNSGLAYNQNYLPGPGGEVPISRVNKLQVCPVDVYVSKNQDSLGEQPNVYSVTSYVGCGGTEGADPVRMLTIFNNDGILGWNHKAVKSNDITDGHSNTIMFGERHHFEPIFDQGPATQQPAFVSPILVPRAIPQVPVPTSDKFAFYGWAFHAGRPVDVTAGTGAPLNFRLPQNYWTLPAATQLALFRIRLNAFGSGHTLGANFAMADGSVRFILNRVDPVTYAALGPKADNITPGDF